VLEPFQIDQLLRSGTLARLGCSAGGRPYVVPVCYVAEGVGRVESLLLHSFAGLKVRMMRDNPHVCIEVDEIEGLERWRTAVLDGFAEELHGEEARSALALLARRVLSPLAGELVARGGDPFRPPGGDAPDLVFRVHVSQATGREARAPRPRGA